MRNVLEGVLHRLAGAPPTSESERLRQRASGYLREVDGWRYSHPTRHEREALMKRVLALHDEVARLEQTSRAVEGVA